MVQFKKILTRGLQSALARTPIENGKIRFAFDTGRLFIDDNDVRIEITDFCRDYTEEGIKNIISPLPKIYLSSDTHKLMMYDASNTEWVYLSGKLADIATNASTAQYSIKSKDSESATNASTAQYAVNASTAYSSSLATSARYSNNASTAEYAKNSSTAEYSKNASTANMALNDANGNGFLATYAPLESPLFSGSPSVPTPLESSNNNQIANTEFVTKAIKNAVSAITGIDFVVLSKNESLPKTGAKGTFYLVPLDDGDDNDAFEEYVWIEATNKYEHIGTKKIDITGYINGFKMGGTGNAITNISTSEDGTKLLFEKEFSFLTEHPSITLSDPSSDVSTPHSGDAITVIDSVSIDEFGHLKGYSIKKITLPDSVSSATNASTAKFAKNATNASTASYAISGALYKGATEANDAIAGLVPAATSDQKDYYLKGDGTWGEINVKKVQSSLNGVIVSDVEPGVDEAGLLWIDTGNNGMAKYRTSTASTEWILLPSVWS